MIFAFYRQQYYFSFTVNFSSSLVLVSVFNYMLLYFRPSFSIDFRFFFLLVILYASQCHRNSNSSKNQQLLSLVTLNTEWTELFN